MAVSVDETAAAAPAALAAAQRAMRHAYRGGCYGQLASGLVWTASAALATWGTPRRAIVALVVGGMGIYPATLALMRLDGRRPPSGRDNPLLSLGAQVALVLPASMPVLAPLLAGAGARAFFPAMLVLVGAHYLPFVSCTACRRSRCWPRCSSPPA
jgi:hypothetical protein